MPRPRMYASAFRHFNSLPRIIRFAVLMHVRFPLSLRSVEDLLFERGIEICHETTRQWWNWLGPLFASDIRRQLVSRMKGSRQWRWHVDLEGEVLESGLTRKRGNSAALAPLSC